MEVLGYVIKIEFTPRVNKRFDNKSGLRYHVNIHPRDEEMFKNQAGNRWKLDSGPRN
jgi:hypothetical protein